MSRRIQPGAQRAGIFRHSLLGERLKKWIVSDLNYSNILVEKIEGINLEKSQGKGIWWPS